jgi:hypothetical protein
MEDKKPHRGQGRSPSEGWSEDGVCTGRERCGRARMESMEHITN